MKEARKQYGDQVKAMHQRILLDLAAKGFSDSDIAGVEQDTHVDAGSVVGWTFRVVLATGRTLQYTLDSRHGSPILCDGKPLAPIDEA